MKHSYPTQVRGETSVNAGPAVLRVPCLQSHYGETLHSSIASIVQYIVHMKLSSISLQDVGRRVSCIWSCLLLLLLGCIDLSALPTRVTNIFVVRGKGAVLQRKMEATGAR